MVRPGLYMYCVPSGGSGVLRVGWLRHKTGDEYEVDGDTCPYRGNLESLQRTLESGPHEDWTFEAAKTAPVPVNRYHLHVVGAVKYAPWAKALGPIPPGWRQNGEWWEWEYDGRRST